MITSHVLMTQSDHFGIFGIIRVMRHSKAIAE